VGFAVRLDALYASGGNSAIVQELGRESAGLVAVWAAMRGLSLAAMRQHVKEDAALRLGHDHSLRFVRYAFSGGARAVMADMLGPAARRVMRVTCREWRAFMQGSRFADEEKAVDERIASLVARRASLAAQLDEQRRADRWAYTSWRKWEERQTAPQALAQAEAELREQVVAYAGQCLPLMAGVGAADVWYAEARRRRIEPDPEHVEKQMPVAGPHWRASFAFGSEARPFAGEPAAEEEQPPSRPILAAESLASSTVGMLRELPPS
jgi:hypothetical protein